LSLDDDRGGAGGGGAGSAGALWQSGPRQGHGVGTDGFGALERARGNGLPKGSGGTANDGMWLAQSAAA
jgi:hypothetical protein